MAQYARQCLTTAHFTRPIFGREDCKRRADLACQRMKTLEAVGRGVRDVLRLAPPHRERSGTPGGMRTRSTRSSTARRGRRERRESSRTTTQTGTKEVEEKTKARVRRRRKRSRRSSGCNARRSTNGSSPIVVGRASWYIQSEAVSPDEDLRRQSWDEDTGERNSPDG